MSNRIEVLLDKFWLTDPNILFNSKRLIEFFPTTDMGLNEQLNAITRLSVYLSVIMYSYSGNYYYMFIFIITLIFTYLIYKSKSTLTDLSDSLENFTSKTNYIEPTKDNPFMNISLNDYTENPHREAAIKRTMYRDHNLDKDIESKFNINLYKDLDDIFDKSNSQRQYYTTPITTIPNNQQGFADWLYKTPKTCKEANGDQCLNNNYTPPYFGSRYQH